MDKTTKKKEIKNQPVIPFLLTLKGGNSDNNSNEENSPRDELQLKIIDEVYSTENIEVKTDLNHKQIISFTKGTLFYEEFKSPLIKNLVDTLAIYSVSKERKGRKEFENIAKAINSPEEIQTDPRIRDRLLGQGI